MPPKKKTPAVSADRKGVSRHEMYFYPRRCEREGCDCIENMMKCGSCKMVMYCSKEHQKEDWKLHKQECVVFQRNGIEAFFYDDSTMLAKYPLHSRQDGQRELYASDDGDSDEDNSGSEDDYESGEDDDAYDARMEARGKEKFAAKMALLSPEEQAAKEMRRAARQQKWEAVPNTSCELCASTPRAKPMTFTECCSNPICDTQHEYVMFSYSRAHCSRSHQRYTLCGHHGIEAYCDKDKDWRECTGCALASASDQNSTPDRLWRGLNPYNFCPLLTKDVPRHSLCETCPKCSKKFMGGLEGCSYTSDGLVCPRCAGLGRF